jgi:hypothetical protein
METTVNTHRTQVQWASGLNFLAAVWLFISAFAVFASGPMMTNNVICGIVVAVLAAIRALGAYDQAWVSWLNALIGVWVVVSPWAVAGQPGPGGPTHGMIINNCITGGLIIALSAWSAVATNSEPDRGTYPGTATPSFGR